MGRPHSTKKDELLKKLMPLLAAEGTAMCDDDLREGLRKLHVDVLHTLHYRVERMLERSFVEGQEERENQTP